jgi:hypothetical protein
MGQFLVYINGLAILIGGEEVSSSSTVTEQNILELLGSWTFESVRPRVARTGVFDDDSPLLIEPGLENDLGYRVVAITSRYGVC